MAENSELKKGIEGMTKELLERQKQRGCMLCLVASGSTADHVYVGV